jgi:precorrin-2 dehydrogenase/sirohydrochlorin ferrochelatase
MALYFPIAICLEGRRCVVVGGGAVAARRVESLLEAGGDITVVAPQVCAELKERAETGRIRLLAVPYETAHLAGAFLVVAATSHPQVNAAVAADARACGILCNDAQAPERGNFIVPSVVRRGDLLITVTTGGGSPSLAMRIRDEIAGRYGPEYAAYVALLGEIRTHVLQTIPDPARRRRALAVVAADETILPLLQAGRAGEARERAYSCISSLSD